MTRAQTGSTHACTRKPAAIALLLTPLLLSIPNAQQAETLDRPKRRGRVQAVYTESTTVEDIGKDSAALAPRTTPASHRLLPVDGPSNPEDLALVRGAGAYTDFVSLEDLTPAALQQITAERGIDFATALLYDRILRSARHGPFIEAVRTRLTCPVPSKGKLDVLLAVAPGAYYREIAKNGGDGRLLREEAAKLGCRTALIPTSSMGTLAENGRQIVAWLQASAEPRILLASLSKGGADIKTALALPGAAAAFQKVIAWLNVSGTVAGSPGANWLAAPTVAAYCHRCLFRLLRLDFQVVRELHWGPGGRLDQPLELPPHLRLVTLAGFPTRRHLTTGFLRAYHRRLSPLGPNDGITLLADACSLPGAVYPVWGADHYLRPPWDIRRLAAALAGYLADELNLWT